MRMRIIAIKAALAAAIVLAGITLPASVSPSLAADCTQDEFATAVDQAGASLRAFNAETNPKLQSRLKELGAKNGWAEAEIQDKGLDFVADDRVMTFDMEANELLSKIDELGRPPETGAPDCQKLVELKAAGTRLLTVMKEKSQYTLDKLDQELGLKVAAKPAPSSTAPAPKPQAQAPAPKPERPNSPPWSTTTERAPSPAGPPAEAAWALPPDAFITNEQGYTIDEIREVTRGFFGTISTEIAAVIEHAFSKSGRPSSYILGTEGGGAFLAGLRYGKGTLYQRSGGSQPVYWHGPSLGGDIGAEGARTLYLIYNLDRPDALFRRFAAIDGTAFLVGGVGIRFLKGGDVIMAPIRSGIGLRLGASVGYVRFTPKPTWNPF